MDAVPNPFSASVALVIRMPRAMAARIDLFDVTGRRVREMQLGRLNAGVHTVLWDARDESGHEVASGIYQALLRAGETTSRIPVMFLTAKAMTAEVDRLSHRTRGLVGRSAP